MDIDLELFGALRGLEAGDRLTVQLNGGQVADLRAALQAYASANWPSASAGILASCAFATSSEILRDAQPLPADGRMAVLPPVSGG
ncbi:MoaD/ThiS family protein [Thermomonas sp.]|uniref:MoaD/ThiS family protein n=1 Tax=Thermomonas sp. TaxID=1971895 RepID=UPI00248A16BA|nr:MoaD/ThiS family protein [Thermomonas sp.]MDI1252144.1 MoaD/ThiS family protein [Thermomonas sp.]